MVSALPVISSLALLHAGYSSWEYTQLTKTHSIGICFPQDIALEVVISLALFLVHTFLFNKTEKELSLVDQGRIIQRTKLRPLLMKDAVVDEEIKGGNIFKIVDTRAGFIDIVRLREEFAQWEDEQQKEQEKKSDKPT